MQNATNGRTMEERRAMLEEIRQDGPQGIEPKKRHRAILAARAARTEKEVLAGLPLPPAESAPVETAPVQKTEKPKRKPGEAAPGSNREKILRGLSETEFRPYKTVWIRAGFTRDPFLRDYLRSLVSAGIVEQMERPDGSTGKPPLFFRLRKKVS